MDPQDADCRTSKRVPTNRVIGAVPEVITNKPIGTQRDLMITPSVWSVSTVGYGESNVLQQIDNNLTIARHNHLILETYRIP
jgi:hypothetical protein